MIQNVICLLSIKQVGIFNSNATIQRFWTDLGSDINLAYILFEITGIYILFEKVKSNKQNDTTLYTWGALTLERGMGMCRGHDPLFSEQSPLPSLPI